MSKRLNNKLQETLSNLFQALINFIKAQYKLAPAVVIVGVFLIAAVILISIICAKIMMGIVILLVLVISVIIFSKTANYGEAALALVAGLLTAFSVNWTVSRFVVFIVAWGGFSLLVLLISSVKIAAKTELLYRKAAISIDPDKVEDAEKQLRAAAEATSLAMLGPIERAESILSLSSRKFPISLMRNALQAIEKMATVTQIDHEAIALLLADLFKMIKSTDAESFKKLQDDLLSILRDTPASPEEVINAFKKTRRLVFSGELKTNTYFRLLREGLEKGLSPEDLAEYIKKQRALEQQ